MSELLKDFYVAYLAWIDDGASDEACFDRANGLCSNLRWFAMESGRLSVFWASMDNMYADFIEAGLNPEYPFDSFITYKEGSELRKQHTNPKRIAWVRNQVEKIKEL